MEKKRLRKRDILRMDGLLPPTRRLPVCDAVPGASDKKKEKKWSIGGILRRISSIKDYESSSNDEEIVYCKRTPKAAVKLSAQPASIVLHSVANKSDRNKRTNIKDNIRYSTDSSHLRDSLHSRSTDGSLDGLGKKNRKNKLKARTEAKRGHLCAESSSEEDCRRSNNSLNRFHGADGTQGGQKGNACNRKTRAARTERYIKRLSKDEVNGSGDTLNDLHSKRCSLDCIENAPHVPYIDENGLCRPPVHSRQIGMCPNNHAFPVPRPSAVCTRNADCAALPGHDVGSFDDFRRYSIGQCITDMNQNNTYGKITRNISRDAHSTNRQDGHFFTYPAKNVCHYAEPFNCAIDRRLMHPNNQPPEPPPRDPRYRMLGHGYSSYPANKGPNVPNSHNREGLKTNVSNGVSNFDWRNVRSYETNTEVIQCDKTQREPEMSMPSNLSAEFHNSLECINNKHSSSRHYANDCGETETTRCRRRNTRNNQLNCNDTNYDACKAKSTSANICESSKYETILSYPSVTSAESLSVEKCERQNSQESTSNEEVLERRRSSKNLEEALSELEAIYNSLRLGDEDLLDRAERRSMEEFSLKQEKNELDAVVTITPDSPDRTKDDMAYRRMHPKERPTSFSDIAGQSALSNISYLIASPILSRKDSADNLLARTSSTYPARRNEPDVTRDDVVFRSINHANNTLRVMDPQPPFGIPLGPVTTATESDYLHTTPSKPEQPRSPYIPQCEPDVVTDDLAYRTLRKDAGATRNIAENRIDVPRVSAAACGMKKERAVRSLSANLYGLINHDRAHLRREPSLDAIRDELQDAAKNVTMFERPEYLRRVVSDGELSDNDAHRRKETTKCGVDINGNHSAVDAYQKKLRAYGPPETTTRKGQKEKIELSVAELSDAMLSSKLMLDDKFWQEYLHSESTVPANSDGTETDLTAYSRLCQDLTSLIKNGEDALSMPEPVNAEEAVATVDKLVPYKNSGDPDANLEDSQFSKCTPKLSVDNHCLGLKRANGEDDESEITESPVTLSTDSVEFSESAAASNLDFYLRLADENVKLIAEAFGTVADHLRDANRASAQRKNISAQGLEIESQSGSARSSALYSQDDTYDDRSVGLSKFEEARLASKRGSFVGNDGERSNADRPDDVSAADAELDLSRAVRDLQLAAASFCGHSREIENLEIGRGKAKTDIVDVAPVPAASVNDGVGETIRRLSPVEAPRQRQERHQEETVELLNGTEPPHESREEDCAGERTVCEFNGSSCYAEDPRPDGPRVTYVTNLITVALTTYAMVLLACFLALLLAIVAASP